MPFDIQLKTGRFRFSTLADVRTFWCVFFSRIYGVKETDRLIVDAGANIGSFTLYALLQAPQSCVIAIEPAPDTCSRLRELLEEHGLSERCTIHQAALGSQIGTTTIDLTPESQFRSTGTGSTCVPVFTLDAVVRHAEVDMLKLDIEGAEYSVLAEDSPRCLRQVQRISMEFHPNGSLAELTAPLERAGLKCISVRDDGNAYGLALFERVSVSEFEPEQRQTAKAQAAAA
ncbi:MAG TPA: FkbM family methyltransferase [Bryobacteraceae bacterium]|jgi:FkbM family methyltransferase